MSSPPLHLTVQVIAGKDLSAKDGNGFSDPYCVLRINTDSKGVKRTHFIKKSLNPIWNETFEFGEIKSNSILKLTCWDHDTFSSDDFMGQFSINLEKLAKEPTNLTSWFILQGRGKDEEITGRIHLSLVTSVPSPVPKSGASTQKSSGNIARMTTSKKISSLTSFLSATPAPSTSPVSTSKVFGVELDSLMERQKSSHPDLLIPIAMKSIIDYIVLNGLDEVGVFRLAGNQIDIQTLKDKIDSGFLIPSSPSSTSSLDSSQTNINANNDNADTTLKVQEYNIHDIATLFKRFLRELPTPLLSFPIYHRFIATPEIEEERDNPQFLDKIKENILGLPKNSLFLLKDVINLMVLVTRNSEFNKMSTQNLAICIGPNLIWSPQESDPTVSRAAANLSNFDQANRISTLTEILIQQREYIFHFEGIARVIEVDEAKAVQKEAMRLFLTYDTDGNGVMDRTEFTSFYYETLMTFTDRKPTDEDIDLALNILDKDKNGEISFDEFRDWWIRMNMSKGKRLRSKGRSTVNHSMVTTSSNDYNTEPIVHTLDSENNNVNNSAKNDRSHPPNRNTMQLPPVPPRKTFSSSPQIVRSNSNSSSIIDTPPTQVESDE